MSINIRTIFLIGSISFLLIYLGKFITVTSPQMTLLIVLTLFTGIATLIKPQFGLVILIFAMLLSPEIIIAQTPAREVTIRAEDFLLILIFLIWFFKTAYYRGLGVISKTPLNTPIVMYSFACIFSSILAILTGGLKGKEMGAFFFILKYIQYFLLYFLVVSYVSEKKQIKQFLIAGVITYIIVCIYGYVQIAQGVERISTPFEGGVGEAATLGGYFLIVMAVLLGLFVCSSDIKHQVLYLSLFLLSVLPFLHTLSRASFFGFIPMYLSLIIFSKKKKLTLIFTFLICAIFFNVLMPERVTGRIKETFLEEKVNIFQPARWRLEPSAEARVMNWKHIITERFPKKPFFGYGVTGVGLVDAQYPRILGETGIFGLIAFLFIIFTIFKHSIKAMKEIPEPFYKGLILGFISGFAGILTQAIGTNTFIIVRIMEPFWFLCAIVMTLPKILNSQQCSATL